MKIYPWTALPVAAIVCMTAALPPAIARDTKKTDAKIEKAVEVFEDIMSSRKSRIPRALLQDSEGIAIIPDVIRAGFIFGGTRGTGVMVVRQPEGTWSNPAFVDMTAGSIGLQIGAKSSDIVLVFRDRDTLNEFMTGSFKLGGSVSGTAGPVESSPVDSAEGFDDAPIYTYARSSGLFGGVSLEGSELKFNRDRNEDFYGQRVSARQIFNNPLLTAPSVVNILKDTLEQAEAGTLSKF